jgi:hypothetical protein
LGIFAAFSGFASSGRYSISLPSFSVQDGVASVAVMRRPQLVSKIK